MSATDARDDLRPVWEALQQVKDPEIPVISVVELGLIESIRREEDRIVVRMLPTFVGCPALELLQNQIRLAVMQTGCANVDVRVTYDPPWTTERISDEGLRKLKDFGLAPPSRGAADAPFESNFHRVPCPLCGSRETRLESIFGPTLCRAIHYCNVCQQSFEQFKPVA